MLKKFREFAMRGNVIDMAIGVGGTNDQDLSVLLFDHCHQGRALSSVHFRTTERACTHGAANDLN